MLNSGKKFALCTTKKINILTLVLSEKKFMNETKNHNPHLPFKLNGRSLMVNQIEKLFRQRFFLILLCFAILSTNNDISTNIIDYGKI